MGAHNAATEQVARHRARLVRDRLAQNVSDGASQRWVTELDAALEYPAGGTLKAWMQAHDGEPVDTLQVRINIALNGVAMVNDLWAPGLRRVDAARAVCVHLDGSRRDYAGVTTLIANDRQYIGFGKWGERTIEMLVYVA